MGSTFPARLLYWAHGSSCCLAHRHSPQFRRTATGGGTGRFSPRTANPSGSNSSNWARFVRKLTDRVMVLRESGLANLRPSSPCRGPRPGPKTTGIRYIRRGMNRKDVSRLPGDDGRWRQILFGGDFKPAAATKSAAAPPTANSRSAPPPLRSALPDSPGPIPRSIPDRCPCRRSRAAGGKRHGNR